MHSRRALKGRLTMPGMLAEQLGLDERRIADRLVYLEFLDEDAACLGSLSSWAAREVDGFLKELYDYQFSYPEFITMTELAGSNRERLAAAQRRYVLDLFRGMPDDAYVESRLRIGVVHARLGITPHWFLSSYRLYEWFLLPRLRRHWWYRPIARRRAWNAIRKLISFDSGLVLEMYLAGMGEERRFERSLEPGLRTSQAGELITLTGAARSPE